MILVVTKAAEPNLLLVSIATEATDGYKRFERSLKAYEYKYEVSFETKWRIWRYELELMKPDSSRPLVWAKSGKEATSSFMLEVAKRSTFWSVDWKSTKMTRKKWSSSPIGRLELEVWSVRGALAHLRHLWFQLWCHSHSEAVDCARKVQNFGRTHRLWSRRLLLAESRAWRRVSQSGASPKAFLELRRFHWLRLRYLLNHHQQQARWRWRWPTLLHQNLLEQGIESKCSWVWPLVNTEWAWPTLSRISKRKSTKWSLTSTQRFSKTWMALHMRSHWYRSIKSRSMSTTTWPRQFHRSFMATEAPKVFSTDSETTSAKPSQHQRAALLA